MFVRNNPTNREYVVYAYKEGSPYLINLSQKTLELTSSTELSLEGKAYIFYYFFLIFNLGSDYYLQEVGDNFLESVLILNYISFGNIYICMLYTGNSDYEVMWNREFDFSGIYVSNTNLSK